MATTMADAPARQRHPNWWFRNWIWAAPAIALALGGGAVLLVMFIFGLIKSADAYQQPFAAAKADARVKAALGEPVGDRWYVTGQIKTQNDAGYANLQIPLSGPKGDATLYVVGTRAQGKWTYQTMKVVPNGGAEIDLLKVEEEQKDGVEQ
jgi:hypothetical protein